ncbi:NAD(P)/FAD-dependent oxidoreductase [Arenivirga flava]|uniref:Glycerol-3-phosphate dehydrogenase n=1 Tax=Arenivirga flava TaxID=1930060 RepID=A0AA37UNU4_9MICO|nr:FAD-dependent oxidoreductase [Arenivirga flava]GMA28371.1 glycerol-3-phosphate dehydrogenase [Arenivirga flava]
MARLTADVTIIGGGIAGLSLAAALAEEASVIVVEAERGLAQHTSSRSAQQLQPSYGPDPVRALTAATLELMPAIEDRMGERILSPRPLVVGAVAPEAAELAAIARGEAEAPADPIEALLAQGRGFRRIDPEHAHELLPFLRRDVLRGAAIDDASREVRVPLLLRAYEEMARERDARILTGWRVREIQRRGSSWVLETEGGDVSTGHLVNAAGAWADEVASLAGLRPRGLRALRRTVAIAAPLRGTIPVDAPMFVDDRDGVYFRPHEEGLLASPMEDAPSAAEDAQPREELVAETLRRVEALTELELEVRRAWTGLRVDSPDHLPVMGRDGDVETFFWLAAQSGYGIQTSAAAGRLAAAEIVEADARLGEPADLAWSALSPNRAALFARD